MSTHDIRRAASVDIKYNLREAFAWTGTITDQDSAAVSLTGKTLVYSIRKTENGTAVATLTTTANDITISGAGNNIVTISSSSITGLTERTYYHDLENTTDNYMLFDGLLVCGYGAYNT
jgi:hypothetical protein